MDILDVSSLYDEFIKEKDTSDESLVYQNKLVDSKYFMFRIFFFESGHFLGAGN